MGPEQSLGGFRTEVNTTLLCQNEVALHSCLLQIEELLLQFLQIIQLQLFEDMPHMNVLQKIDNLMVEH